MFMVVITVCSIATSCFNVTLHVRGYENADYCMLSMLKVAISIHIRYPNYKASDVVCIPEQES